MKIYDLSQPLNQECSFWPFYPPFEVKYIKRKSEQGVNAQYIMTSNHMGTHLDAPRHFVTNGKTIDQIPIEWCYGPGVIVDLSDALDDLDVFTPEMIEARADIHDGDILFIHTGWSKYSFLEPAGDEERFWAALDGDVEHHGPPSILISLHWHARSAGEIARHQGAGIGRSLIEHVVEQARVAGCRSVTLNVNRQNVSAIGAYERCGFAIRGHGDFPIGDGFVMEDFIMVRDL